MESCRRAVVAAGCARGVQAILDQHLPGRGVEKAYGVSLRIFLVRQEA